MSTSQPIEPTERASPRILYLGTSGAFSLPPLEALLADGLPVCAVVMPASGDAPVLKEPIIRHSQPRPTRAGLPILTPFVNRTIAQLAWQYDIPVMEVSRLSSAPTLKALAAFQPDVICVACFPWRLPKALLNLPPLGCLNLHPSLLPAYRGPIPEFWILRSGESSSGVTIHLMDEGFDTGDILLQERFAIPDGISIAELERREAILGAPLMARAVRLLASGKAARIKQAPERSSYYSLPTAEDFVVPVTRPARWAFNFIRGVADWDGPLELHIGNERFPVRQALEYQADGVLGQPYRREGLELWAQCAPGVLHALLR